MHSATTPGQQPQILPWNARVIAALAGAAFLGVLPLLIKGNVAAHDLQFHVSSWNEVANQWRHGTLWPRWAAMANYGFGEPRFIFYPPISWLLGGMLALWLPVCALAGTFSFIAFFAAGAGTFALARRYLPSRFAIGAAVLYALNPYHLITVYWDFRVAEMLASAVFPVAILCALECAEDLRAAAGLAVGVAAVWLMNAPAGVMLMYTLAMLLVALAAGQRSIRPLLHGAIGMFFGVGLAAFYLVPAAQEQSWVNIFGIFGAGLTAKENFLFSVATDAPHTYFNFLVSGIALEQIALFVFTLPFAWKAWRKTPSTSRWMPALALIGALAAMMMFRFSNILWSLPKMQFVQFPWRWMLVLNLVLCIVGMLALATARTKWVWIVLITAFLGHTERDVIRHATWGKRAVAEMYWSTSADGYRGATEYLPHDVHVAPKPYVLPNVPLVALDCQIGCGQGNAKIDRWTEEEKRVQVSTAVPALLMLKLYDYPAWQVRVDDAPVQHEPAYSGQVTVDLPPGRHTVDVTFTRTPDRTAGILISLLSIIFLALFMVFTSKPRKSASNRGPEQAIS